MDQAFRGFSEQALKSLALLSVLAAVSIQLQGCGNDGDSTTTTSPPPGRKGSFLALGDWGWDPDVHGNLPSRACQQAIADSMAAKQLELGDVKFVINVGDSFYPIGVANKSDPQWDTKWRHVYSEGLRSIPWYSVYGNHDYVGDPCACADNASECAQINDDIGNTSFFAMPDFSYFVDYPDIAAEIIAMDTNYYTWLNHTCPDTACPSKCEANLKTRADAAYALFYERVAASTASNLIVFSHYPTDYFPGGPYSEVNKSLWWAPSWVSMTASNLPNRFYDFLPELSNASRHIEYFGGHRHNTDQSSTTSTAPNSNWLVGGGGGWGTESYGKEQGFVVGEIDANGKMTTYSVLVDFAVCEAATTTTTTTA